jgi:hypothetical protein
MSQAAMLGQTIPARVSVVPDVSAVHETPPFVVRRICPKSPVAKQVVVVEHPNP